MSSEISRQLKEARESLGLSLEDIQEKTRILKGHLIAIENGQFDKLPSPYYARKYLRQYAEAVGLEPQHILRKFRTDEMTQQKLLEWTTQSMAAVNPEERSPSQMTGSFKTDKLEQTAVHRPNTAVGQVYQNDPQSIHSTQRLPALLSDTGALNSSVSPMEEPLSLSRTNPSVFSRRRGRHGAVRNSRTRKKNGWLGKYGFWLWALSGVLLVSITVGGVLFFLNNNGETSQAAAGNNQVTLSNVARDVDPSAQLTLVDKNADTNKYELSTQKQIQLQIQSIDVCRVVISEQKNGAPIKDVTLRPGEVFSFSGAHAELWVHLQYPQNIRILVNGKPVDPSFYVHIVKKLT